MTEAKNPTTGNANLDTAADPSKAKVRVTMAHAVAPMRTHRLSKSFNSSNPTAQPTVIKPQNQATACAPSVCGFKP